jgi:hypothetical protein
MNTEATLQQLRDLRLEGMAKSYEAILTLPSHRHPEAHHLLAQLVQNEKDWKQVKHTQMYLKLSKLRYAASLERLPVPNSGIYPKSRLAFTRNAPTSTDLKTY